MKLRTLFPGWIFLPAHNRLFYLKPVLLSFLLTLILGNASAQISIPNSTAITENFNGVGTGLPANWKLTNSVLLATNATMAIGNANMNFAYCYFAGTCKCLAIVHVNWLL